MNNQHKIITSYFCISLIICFFISCENIGFYRIAAEFKNCTEDTLLIGASQYNDIDSVKYILERMYSPEGSSPCDSMLTIWEKNINEINCIYPDSLCAIGGNYLFNNNDTCYFFLIKWDNAKKFSLHEIRSLKLYNRWATVRGEDGRFNNSISYRD